MVAYVTKRRDTRGATLHSLTTLCLLESLSTCVLQLHSALLPAGGNMVAYVTKRRETRESRGGLCLDEEEANFFFRQLIWAVQFCHNNHVAHR